MASRGSQHNQDEITWETSGIKLGTAGLDLRPAEEPPALTELLNARFDSELIIGARPGHRGYLIRDASDAPPTMNPLAPHDWTYGHGQRVSSVSNAEFQDQHYYVPGRGQGVFRFQDTDVVWTGD